MLSWAIPLRNKNLTSNSKLLGLANAFAGGIFLMLAFGHMLPHSVEVLESIGKDRNIAFKFTLLGYLLVFFIEKIAFNSHALLHEAGSAGNEHTHSHSHSPQGSVQPAIKHVANEQTPLSAVPVPSPRMSSASVDKVQSSTATVIEADDAEVRETKLLT